MTLWWIGDAVLALVVLPVVIVLLQRVLAAARAIAPSVDAIAAAAASASADLDAAGLLVVTRDHATTTIATVADYGGSLDAIVDDAG